ncbi:MAG: transglycosylase domain-containing protein [Bdellovibrionales bacterium]|nr:transglycosylase domain-containing protein [Bdellovibrionales bacterium]
MKRGIVILLILVGVLGLAAFAGLGFWIWKIDTTWSPLIEPRLRERQQIGSIRILAKTREGKEQWVGSLTSGRTEERQPLKLSEIPPQLTQAIVNLEDPRFMEHGGFDILGILRAAAANIVRMRYTQGGSTITQQLVKNVFLSNERTLHRKFTELVLAALVEKRFTKDEILEAYMNEVYLGQINNIEIHGVGRAAEYYFGKKLNELETHEVALLAAMIAGPGYYSPWRHMERTRARRDRVLRSLAEAKLILPQELEAAMKKDLPKNPNFVATTRSGYLMDAVREDIVASHTEMEVLRGGFDVHLDLDLDLQERAEKILAQKSTEWGPGFQGIVIAADPTTCTIKAYVGGTDYRVTQLDRIRQSRRPIGSLMKPLELSHLLEEDPKLTLASHFDDTKFKWDYDNGRQSWSPINYDQKFRGSVSLRHSIEESINVPIVKAFYEREPTGNLQTILEPVRAYGLDIPVERALPSALLGAIDQTPRQTIAAYLRFTRQAMGLASDAGDFACRLSFDAKTDSTPPTSGTYGQVGTRLMIAAMEGGLRRGTGKVFGAKMPLNQEWASKTGTSSDKRDSWYVLLSPKLVVLTWMGRDDNQETKYTGATGALPITSDLMLPYAKTETAAWSWPMPKEIQWVTVRADKGCMPSDEVLHKLGMNTHLPTSTTPPPEPFQFEGVSYVYELFRNSALPPKCD